MPVLGAGAILKGLLSNLGILGERTIKVGLAARAICDLVQRTCGVAIAVKIKVPPLFFAMVYFNGSLPSVRMPSPSHESVICCNSKEELSSRDTSMMPLRNTA